MKISPETKPSFSVNPGDIFQLGQHRLACGDAKDPSLVTSLLSGVHPSLILTDPPYGIDYVSSKMGIADHLSKPKTILNDHTQSDAEYTAFTCDWLLAVKEHLTKKNTYYIFNSDKMIFSLRDGLLQAGFKFTQLLIWVKTHSIIGRMDYLPQHELVAYGWFGTHLFRRSKDKSVIIHPKPQKSRLHPTMKPIALLRTLLLNSSKIGDAVYDPFGGSGSTLIACEQTKRTAYMVELDPEYCHTIINRYETLTGNGAVKL